MASIFAVFLFVFAVFPSRIINGNTYPFCSPLSSNYSGPKLPTFPEAFEATVEVTIVNRNYSVLYTEFYDKNANKGALKKIKNGTSTYTIYNYNEDEVMVIDEESQNCSLQNISTMHRLPFFGKNGSKIEGMADLFRFGGSFNETFIGQDIVRGIPCFHWQTCINHHNHSYLVDYYFSIPTWSMIHGTGKMEVVRAIINGTTTHAHHSHGSLPGNTSRSFYHVYDFFSFKPGPPKPSVFEIPRGVFCAGMKDRKPLPEMKSVFSLEIEWIRLTNKSVFLMKEYYDIDRNVAMFQHHDYHHRNYGQTRIVHDFTHDIVYNISGSVCQNVTRLFLNNTWDSKETADHHIRMKTSSELLFSNNKSGIVYTGSTTVRGIDADVWIMKKDQWSRRGHHVVTEEFYFSKKSWNMRAGSLSNQSQVLLRIDRHDPRTHSLTRMNIINYDAESVPLSVFNINPCFVDNRAVISIKVKGAWMGEVSKYETQFNVGVRKSVAEAAVVSSLRVDNIWNGKSSEYIQIWFTLLGKPPITSPNVKNIVENNLTQAIDALRKTVQGGDLEITWSNPEKKMSTKAEKFFYDSMSSDNPTPRPVNPTADHHGIKQAKRGISGGAVAGIAFLMIAIGICIGLGIAHVIMKRRGTSLFQYQRQE